MDWNKRYKFARRARDHARIYRGKYSVASIIDIERIRKKKKSHRGALDQSTSFVSQEVEETAGQFDEAVPGGLERGSGLHAGCVLVVVPVALFGLFDFPGPVPVQVAGVFRGVPRRLLLAPDPGAGRLRAAGLGMRTGGGSSEPDCCLSGREVSLSDRRKTISGGSVATRAVPTSAGETRPAKSFQR